MSLQDAFPGKKEALAAAADIRSHGVKGKVSVRKIKPQGGYGGYLKYGVFHSGKY